MTGPAYFILELSDAEKLRSFVSEANKASSIEMTEDEIKAALKSVLERTSWQVHVNWGKKEGAHIEATSGNRSLIIEAKPHGKTRQALGNNFLQVLGQILQRMSDSIHQYGVALPAHPSYAELVLKLPKNVRQVLRLDFYFVRRSGTVHEVGVFKWTDG